MAKYFPDCLNLYDGGGPRNVHRAQRSTGLVGQNSTVIKGIAANAEGSNQVGDTFRGQGALDKYAKGEPSKQWY